MTVDSDSSTTGRLRSRHLWQGTIVVAVLAVSSVVFALNRPEGPPAVDPPVQRANEWPLELDGRPALFKGKRFAARDMTDPPGPGLYLWQDFQGWHLWVVRGAGIEGPTGVIASDVEFRRADVNGDTGAGGSIQADGRTIRFDFTESTDTVVGIDFGPGIAATTIVIEAAQDGVPLDSRALKLGNLSVAGELPLELNRNAP